MPEKDFAVGSVGIPSVGAAPKKPCYLVVLEAGAQVEHFIALDKPDLLNGFVQVKGIYSDKSEDKIQANFAVMVAATPKEDILDMMFPWHRVHSIKSLVFNANKPSTLVK